MPQVIRSAQAAASVLEPTRLALLDGLRREPASAAGLARKLGLPRQRVNYHLRELERAGVVAFVEERRRGNCTERVVRATARSYLISPEALGAVGASPEEARDRFSASYLVAVAGRALREVGETLERARAAGKRVATLTLETEVRFRDAAERNAFAEELAAEVARLAAKYHDAGAEGGRTFRVFAGAYPAITRGGDEGTDGARGGAS
jgi:DNA-binding transcriptional ArsR family regulator